MSGSRPGGTHSTYQVQIAGLLGPVLRHEFAELSTSSVPVSTVFRLRLDAGQGPADIAAMLERKGLVLLRARPLRNDPTHQTPSGAPQRA